MLKKELLAMRHMTATPKMLKTAREDPIIKRPHPYWGGTYYRESRTYGLFMRSCVENDILKVSVYLPDAMRLGGREPAFEVFLDHTARRFITYDVTQSRWLTSKLDRLDLPSDTVWSMEKWISKADAKTVREYLGTDDGSFRDILSYQREIREEELERRHKKETDPWDADLALTPELPKDWLHWVDKVGIEDNYIFYDYKKGGAKQGYCTYCGKEVPIAGKPLHNKKGRCPRCRHQITFKALGRSGRINTDEYCLYLIQERPDGFMVREFWGSRRYRKGEYKNPEIHCFENQRYIYDHELNCRSYYWGDYKNKSIRWVAGPIVYNYYFHYYRSGGTGRVYGKTLPQLEKTVLRSTGLVKWLRENHLQENPKRYLRIVGAVPQLEQIMKANLPRLASECIEDADKVSKHIKNREATALTKALGIDSQELARLRKHNGGALMLGWLQKEKEYGRPIADEVISWFCSKKIDVFKLDFIWGKMNPLQIYHYLQRQMKESGEPAGQVLTTWQDYLSMAEKLGIDTSDEIIYRARLLRLRHDELVKRMKEKSSEQQALDVLKKYPNVDAICQSVKDKFEYENEQYAIVAPCSALDIIVEGQMLHHCVGSSDRYWDRIERHEAYVLFLRKTSTPHIPYYTLEVEPDGTVRQTRTKFDRQEADIEQAKAFLQEWQAVVAKRLTAGDRKNAEMSRVLREQEFEQMRKDDVRISFGDLAGRRLVDVLTADLMENAA